MPSRCFLIWYIELTFFPWQEWINGKLSVTNLTDPCSVSAFLLTSAPYQADRRLWF
jgi:hypothetical protein